MAIKFLNNIQAEAENTPDIIVKDTTNGLIGRLRAANNYVYLTADHGDSVNSTRITFQVDGDAVGFFSNSLFTAETSVKFSSYGSGTNTGTATYALSVDANGNIIEGTVQSNPAGVDGTGTVGYLTKWLDGDTLTDSNVYEASGDLVTTLNLKSSSSYPQLKLTDTDNSSTSSIRSAGGSLQHVLHDDTKSHVFYPGTTSTELMRIKGSGEVGIGQSNPVENLEIYDASANTWVVVETGSNNAGTQYINTTSAWTVGIKGADSDKFYIGNQEGLSSGYFVLDTSGNLQLTAYTEGYLKSDASGNITVDTSIIEDTLDSVTDRNATTTNAITVGGLTVDTSTLHVDTTNKRVGVGITAPTAQLHVEDNNTTKTAIHIQNTSAGGKTWDIASIGSGVSGRIGNLQIRNETDSANYVEITHDGKIGIGTEFPTQDLHVSGNVRVTGEFIDSNNSGGLSGQILSSTGTGTDWVSLSEIQGVDGTGTANYLAKWSDIDTITDSVVYDDGTNVGIGTSSPIAKLDVSGNLQVKAGDLGGTSGDSIKHAIIRGSRHYLDFKEVRTANGTDWMNTTYKLQMRVDSTNHQSIDFVSDSNALEHIDILTGNQQFNTRFTYDGKVGIGTTAPSSKLHVAGDVRIENTDKYFVGSDFSYITSTPSQDINIVANRHITFSSVISGSTYERLRIKEDGSVGIGTTAPSSILHISASSPILTISNTDTSIVDEQVIGQIDFKSLDASTNMTAVFGSIRTEAEGTLDNGVNDGGKMVFSTFKQPTSLVDQMSIDRDGNLQFHQYTTGVLVTDANGNVSASTDYHTQDTADARYVNVTGDTMTGALNISSSTDWGTATTEALTIKNTGSGGNINAEHSLGRIRWQTNGNNAAAIDAIRDTPGNGNNVDIAFFTNTGGSSTTMAERMRINYDGDVGIGTSVPSTRLYVDGGESTFNRGNSNGTIATFRGKNAEQAVIGTLTSWFDSNVGIGTTSPDAKLDVKGVAIIDGGTGVSSSGVLHVRQNGDESSNGIALTSSHPTSHRIWKDVNGKLNFGPSSLPSAFVQDLSGNVGIGVSSPTKTLDISGNLRINEGDNFTDFDIKSDRTSGNIGGVNFVDSGNNITGQIYGHTDGVVKISSGGGDGVSVSVGLTVNDDQTLIFNGYTAGYLKSDASGNVTVDNSTFLEEEVDTLASVTARGATTSQVTYFNGTVNIGASVGMTFSSSSEGATYTPTESTVGASRYFLRFDTTNDASFPYLTNRTPSGAVVIKTGTAVGGAENEHFRIKGGDGVVDAYFTDVNLGVGTDSPSRKLHVNSGTTNHVAIFESTDSTAFIQLKDSGAYSNIVSADGSLLLEADYGGDLSNSSIRFSVDASEKMRLLSSGNLGIDRTNPLYKLHVYHPTTNVTAQFESGDNQAWISVRDSGYTTYGAMLGCDSNDGYSVILADNSATKRLTIDESGNVRFHAYGAGYLKTNANGTITLDTITSVVDGTGTGGYIPKWSDSDTLTDSIIYDDGDSIGIGTESPTGILDVKGASGTIYDTQVKIVASEETGAADTGGSISFVGHDGSAARTHGAVRGRKENSTVGDYGGYLAFDTRANNAALSEKMRLTGSGKLGIGTNAPSHKLTINTGTNDIYIDEDTNINQGTGSSDQPAIYADSVIRVRQRVQIWDDNDGNNYLDIRDGSTQAIKLTPDGDSWITNDLGLGTTSPDGPLHILKTTSESVIIENSDSSGSSDDLIIKNTNDRDVGLKLETGGGYYHIALDSNGDDSLVFHLADINSPNFEFYQNGNLQLHQYGAGFLKTDANGLVSVDTASYTEAQTLDDVTDLGNSTTNSISVGALDVDGRFVVDSKTMTMTDSFSDALTVTMSNHTGCYVKITAFGDWGSHSSISYLGEFFLNNGAGGYNEPGMIIRQVDGTDSDAIQAQIVDPGGTTGNRDFTIQLKATDTASFTAYITYTIQGMFVSAS